MNTDEITLYREKLAYFIGSTSLFLILEFGTIFIVLLEWVQSGELFSGPIAYSLAAAFILFVYGILAQIKAVNFHNKYNPQAPINWKRTDGYKEYFEHLDEGEKFEQYRVAYKSFYRYELTIPSCTSYFIYCIRRVKSTIHRNHSSQHTLVDHVHDLLS